MTETPQPGWYPDPSGDQTRLRWWDGTQWTDDYAPAQQATPQSAPYAQNPYGANANGPYAQQGTPGQQTFYGQASYLTDTDRNLRLAAFVLNLLSTIGTGVLLIPLAWMVPMTVHSWRLYKGERPNTTAFAVCDLIFCSVIAGVLLLISQKEE